MAFSSDLAKLVADQLTRFVTLNRHQLAGQVANLDFWMAQVRNALETIDGYGVRFVRLSMNQAITSQCMEARIRRARDTRDTRPTPRPDGYPTASCKKPDAR